ncbi:MAG: porphobilinogen synthase [Deltaproteobacteria bacterium]|nr:porphobilinogen synthase [Deltaproteobacteria bacterium]
MAFPEHRLRRLRRSAGLRRLVRETRLQIDQLVLPMPVVGGGDVSAEVPSLPGVRRLSAERAAELAARASDAGIGAVLLCGVGERADDQGSEAWSDGGPVARAARAIRKQRPGLVLLTEVAVGPFASGGRAGPVGRGGDGSAAVDNDAALELIGQIALCHARAGVDILVPIEQIDGSVGFAREALDDKGFEAVAIAASGRLASAFDAAPADGGEPPLLAAASELLDPANGGEALRALALGIEEGADLALIRPSLPALDLIGAARREFELPLAACQGWAEYAMICAAVEICRIDGAAAHLESLLAVHRAGADLIATPWALEAARRLR